MQRRLLSVGLLWVHITYALIFSAGSQRNECEDFSVSWTNGTAPYQLLLIPPFGTPRNISIPSTDTAGTFSTILPFPSGQKYIAVLSDKTGFASGGATDVITTGPPSGSASCDTKDPGVAFVYELNDALQQCRPYTFSEYTGAVQPVTIIGIVPQGTYFVQLPPSGPTSFDWMANVKSGTSVIFLMIDSQGRQGGSSDLLTVSNSDDTTCLNKSSPSSTSAAPSATSATSSATTSASSAPAAKISIAGIAGTVIGALIFLSVTITLALFFLRKNKGTSSPPWHTSTRRDSHRLHSEIDLMHDHSQVADDHYSSNIAATTSSSAYMAFDSNLPLGHEPNPFLLQASDYAGSDNGSTPTPTHLADSLMSAGQRKRAAAGVSGYKPSKFIVHTDVEDTMEPNEDGVIEIPPAYKPARSPLVGLGNIAGSSQHPPN